MVERRVELGVHLDAAAQMAHGNFRSPVFEISASNQVVHLRSRLEPERTFQMSDRFTHLALAHKNSSKPIVRRERVLLDLQRTAQVPLRRIEVAVISANYAEHQQGYIIILFSVN